MRTNPGLREVRELHVLGRRPRFSRKTQYVAAAVLLGTAVFVHCVVPML